MDEDTSEPPQRSASAPALAYGRHAESEPAGGASLARLANGSSERPAANERSVAWSRVAVALLGYVGPFLGRPMAEDAEQHPVLLLKQVMLSVHVPSLLSASAHGPFCTRLVLEKLVSSLTGAFASGAPLSIVREAVSLVAKFFLQNLHTLQRHECFGQMWLMVLRLMLLFIKRGTDDRDTELEEIATETLKNLLCVLLSTRTLGYVAPRDRQGAGQEEVPTEGGEVKIWWQMTWDCIEVFLPGFGEEFAKSMLPDDEQPPVAALPAVASASAPPPDTRPQVSEAAQMPEPLPVPSPASPAPLAPEPSECSTSPAEQEAPAPAATPEPPLEAWAPAPDALATEEDAPAAAGALTSSALTRASS